METNNEFDDAFLNEQAPEAELVAPEEVVESSSVKRKKGTGLIRYLIYGIGGVVLLFIVLVIWATVSSETSDTATQGNSSSAPVAEAPPANMDQGKESDDIELLQTQLKAAQENTAIRDAKYKALAGAYVQLQADYKLIQDKQASANCAIAAKKPEYSVLPVLKGVSLVSVYDGYAFVKKGSTVYSIKIGDKVNNADVIEIDPVLRKVITTKGVIE